MARWPLDPTKLWDAWKEMTTVSDTPVGVSIAGVPALVAAARERLCQGGATCRVYDGPLGAIGATTFSQTDAVLVFVEPGDEDLAEAKMRAATPGVGAVIAVDEGPAATHAVTWYDKRLARVSFSDSHEGWHHVWEAVLQAVSEHFIALGRRYPVLRPYAAEQSIRRTAKQNGLVGVAFIVPGTDMPVMTLNQIKMVLAIAAIHGEEITYERALELLGVVGAGFAFRTVARQALDVVPGLGWAVKGAIGYTGTRALGEAALRYFQHGAPATPGRLAALVGRFRR